MHALNNPKFRSALCRAGRVWVRLLLFTGAAFATPVLAAAEPVEIEIPVRTGGYGIAFYEETARLFEAEQPGVRVNIYGDPRIDDKVRVRVIDGSFPDATFTPYLLWPTLIREGRVVDLTPYLEGPNWEGDARWGDTFLPGALDNWIVGGRVYGLPFSYACWTLFYNKGLFREQGWTEPQTWDEFFTLCDEIKEAGVAPISVTGVYGNYPDAFFRAAYYNLVGGEGWRALNNLEPGARTDPRFIQAAAVLQRVTQNYVLRGWEGDTHTSAQLAFLQGRAAMTVSGSWMVNEMEGRFPDGFELGAMNFPVFPDGRADPTTIQTGADCFFVFNTGDPRREKLTIDFLRFLTSRSRGEAFVRTVDSPVAVRGIPDDAYSERMRSTAQMIARAEEAFNMPQVMLQPPTVRQAVIDSRLELMTGGITPEQFGARLESAAAADRARVANPNLVDVRHSTAATALCLAIVAGLSVLVWKSLGRKRSVGANAQSKVAVDSVYLGRLRPPVAAGFVGPALVLYGAIVLLPCIGAFAWAFTRWDGIGEQTWAGLFNFKWLLLESDAFWAALGNNFYLMTVPALFVVPLALLFATLIHRGVWGAGVFRVVFLFPNILGGIAATLLWMNAYDPHGGLVNAALVGVGNFFAIIHAPAGLVSWFRGFEGYAWLSQANLYRSLIPIYLWMACGFNLILYLAAMEGIDPQLYEAAEIDGAPKWRQFLFITVPMIWDVLAISAVFLVIGGLNTFELIWLLTSQDPATGTHVLGTLMVAAMFKDFALGRATAIAVVMFALVFLGSATVLRAMKREAVET